MGVGSGGRSTKRMETEPLRQRQPKTISPTRNSARNRRIVTRPQGRRHQSVGSEGCGGRIGGGGVGRPVTYSGNGRICWR